MKFITKSWICFALLSILYFHIGTIEFIIEMITFLGFIILFLIDIITDIRGIKHGN